MKDKKAGVNVLNVLVAFFIFSFIFSGFLLIPTVPQDGFFAKYGYTLQDNNLSALDKTNNISQVVRTMVCDINQESSGCEDIPKRPLLQEATNTLRNIAQGGYGVLITVLKSIGIGKTAIETGGMLFGVPPIITDLLVSLLMLVILIIILRFIFNRSDLVL